MSWLAKNSVEKKAIEHTENQLAVLRTKRRIALYELRRALDALEEPDDPPSNRHKNGHTNGKS